MKLLDVKMIFETEAVDTPTKQDDKLHVWAAPHKASDKNVVLYIRKNGKLATKIVPAEMADKWVAFLKKQD